MIRSLPPWRAAVAVTVAGAAGTSTLTASGPAYADAPAAFSAATRYMYVVPWVTVLSPLLMTWFLAAKTGKPLMEKQLSKSRPGYADYVSRTSGFIPLPPRRA